MMCHLREFFQNEILSYISIFCEPEQIAKYSIPNFQQQQKQQQQQQQQLPL
jgi:hypothetical protein